MMNHSLRGNRAYTIVNRTPDTWIIEAQDDSRGPYRSATLALQVALVEVLTARKRGEDAVMRVRDDYGDSHLCELMNKDDGVERCASCQASWLTTKRARPPKCPIFAAIENRSAHL